MNHYSIFETSPAENFWDEHYLGNGRLGMSIRGSLPLECITVNDDTLWSGHEQFYENPTYYENFKKAQALVLEGKVKEANEIVNNEMPGRWLEVYLPLGQVWIMQGQCDNYRTMSLKKKIEANIADFKEYKRELDLTDATERVTWIRDGVRYSSSYYVSHPREAGFVYITADQVGALNVTFALSSKLQYENGSNQTDVWICGSAPEHAEPSYTPVKPTLIYNEDSDALRYALRIRVLDTDGDLICDGTRIYVSGARYCLLAVTAKTDYNGFQQQRHHNAKRLVQELGKQLDCMAGCMEMELHREHVLDYQLLYNRMDVNIGDGLSEGLPLSKRLEMCAEGVDDPSLSALFLQYARYLTIAGSRPGTQPLNLQGIWNDSVTPPWASNYTTNINVEMNYWPCESLNLSECHEPLMTMLKELSVSGKQTAETYYHLDGWVAHHNVDLWRGTEPSCEDASWSYWPMGAAWMCEHIWTHYAYTLDQEFLEGMYPVMRGAARFLKDYLVKDQRGYLVTAPSISPENKFIWKHGLKTQKDLIMYAATGRRTDPQLANICAVTAATTMDMSLIRELFGNVIQAANILGIDDSDSLVEELVLALEKLPPYQTGKYGELLEWDQQYAECEPGMVHISHMYPVYPASLITELTDPTLFEAARRSLERRRLNSQYTHGWGDSWRICLNARFKNSLECGLLIKNVGGGLGNGMVTKESQQMDAIFGLGAGISEMLLQSHQGYIEILPCPTVDWDHGSFMGMRARGGYEVSAVWRDSKLISASVKAEHTGNLLIKAKGLRQILIGDNDVGIQKNDLWSFAMKENEEALLIF